MFARNQIDTFDAKIRKSCFKFRERLLLTSNDVIKSTNVNTWVSSHYMWQRWNNILYIGAQ